MKRVSLFAATAALAMSFAAPFVGHADPSSAQCVLDGVKASGEKCTTQFELTGAQAVSILFTHGDYHPVTIVGGEAVSGASGEHGTVRLEWFDATGALVAKYECPTLAAQADYQPTEVTRLQCTAVQPQSPTYAAGTQTLVVTAADLQHSPQGAPAGGVRLVGRIQFGEPV
jgi:hypothetical protein